MGFLFFSCFLNFQAPFIPFTKLFSLGQVLLSGFPSLPPFFSVSDAVSFAFPLMKLHAKKGCPHLREQPHDRSGVCSELPLIP